MTNVIYYENLKEVPVDLPQISSGCNHNAHMFYIKTDNLLERKKMLDHLIKNNIGAVFHYVPLHSSKAGVQYGRFCGEDKYTTIESERLLRLPLWYGLTDRHIRMISETIKDYYR